MSEKLFYLSRNTTKSNILAVIFRIALFVTIIFPLIVLIARAIIRRNIQFKKIESPKVSLPTPLKTAPKINQSNIRLLKDDAGKEIRVPVGKSFSIELWHSPSTGHHSWKIFQIPSFINQLDQHVSDQNQSPGFDGGGNDYVFVFEPKVSGRGDIVMQLPCSFDASRTEEKKFTIIAS